MDKFDPFKLLFLVALCAILTSLAAVAAPGATSRADIATPGFYRMMLGEYEVTVIWDGTASRQLDQIMSKPDEVRKVFERDHQDLPAPVSINTYLINLGSKLVLIDSGAGNLIGPQSGHQGANLLLSGYEPGQVDAVLLTHLHPDHFGGLSHAGARAFPNAFLYIDKRDADYWLNEATAKAAPAARMKMFQQARAAVEPYLAAGRLKIFNAPSELFPGIYAMPEPGHTVGHTGYRVESKGRRLLVWGDIIHAAEVQFNDPDITIEYDMSAETASATRRRVLVDAAGHGYLVAGNHISFPGLGHVIPVGDSYGWIPLPYNTLAYNTLAGH